MRRLSRLAVLTGSVVAAGDGAGTTESVARVLARLPSRRSASAENLPRVTLRSASDS